MTLGKDGVLIGDANKNYTRQKAIKVSMSEIKSAVGCGDCFMGGLIYGLSKSATLVASVAYGQKCAAIKLRSIKAVSEEINAQAIQQ